jgi:hypothetical protein
MAETYKILGQINPTTLDEKVLYTSPGNTQTLVTNITVANLTGSDGTFGLSVYPSVITQQDLPSTTVNKFQAFTATSVAVSTDAISWTLKTIPSLVDNGLTIIHANGVTILGSADGKGLSATDGTNWKPLTALTSTNTYGFGGGSLNLTHTQIAYGNGIFIRTGDPNVSPQVYSSTDAITWTLRTLPAGSSPTAIAFGNNVFVATNGNAATTAARSSTDGITWTERTLPVSNTWNQISFVNNQFFASRYAAFTNTTTAASSTNGITWTLRTLPSNTTWRTIAFGNSTYVAVAGNFDFVNTAATSTDAITWTVRTLPASTNWVSVAYVNNLFVALSYTTTAATSTNGITWTLRTMPLNTYWSGPVYAPEVTYFNSESVYNIYKDLPIQANSSLVLEPGIVLGPENSIVVETNATSMAVSTFGTELS